MHTKGKFKVFESESYTAVALPLDSEYINVRQYLKNKKILNKSTKLIKFLSKNGEFIIILPKAGKTLFQIEEQIASSGITVFNVLEHFMSYK